LLPSTFKEEYTVMRISTLGDLKGNQGTEYIKKRVYKYGLVALYGEI
jgi:hypothetical protein